MSTAQVVVLAIAGVLAGFAVGSFSCVVIDRLPVELDEPDQFGDHYGVRPWREVFGGTSRCSDCGTSLRRSDMVPVLSWLRLRGRCRGCGSPIPGFHPLVELAVPLVGAGLVLGLGWGWRVVPALVLVPVGIVAATIDLRTMIVPLRLVWPALGVVVAVSGACAGFAGEWRWLFGGLIGILTMAGPLFVIWFILPRGMGFGDVRLAVLLGWVVGFTTIDGTWVTAVFCGAAALTCAAVAGVMMSFVGLAARGRHAKVPFGPGLVVGAFVVIAFGAELLDGFVVR